MADKSEKFVLVNLGDEKAKDLAEAIKNKTCKKILDYLGEKEGTETEIAQALNMPLSTVHYNLQLLKKSGLVKSKDWYWSEKGKKVDVFEPAKKLIVLAPKGSERYSTILRGILPIFFVFLIVGAVAAGYLFLFPYQPDQPPQANDTASTVQGIQEVVNANNQFAFELYSELNKNEEGNMFYSPYSISSALAMTYEGAKGQTADEISSVFHFPESGVLRPNFAAIYNEINKKDKGYELRTGNALWVQQDYPFLDDYIERVEKYYGGKAANVDFVTETEKSRQTINTFIEEQTNDKIKDLIPPGVLSPLTRLVLTNAIYFKGTWKWEFDKADTKDMDFRITPENIIQVPMMHMDNEEAEFNYADAGKLQILELPYKGEDVSMLILLPKQGEDFDFETGERIAYNYTLADIELSAEKLNEYKSQMEKTKMDAIYLPKFEFDTKYYMNDVLMSLGMPAAFSENADFSGMNGKRDLMISQVIHQAYVKVDEQGTEAAAATAVIMELTAIMPQNVFMADHPFIFIIQEKQTGNILFMGKVVNPLE